MNSREKFISEAFLIRTLVIAAYLVLVGEAWVWLLSPLIVLYGNFFERKIQGSLGLRKYGLQFLLCFTIMSVLVGASTFVQKLSNGNSLAVGMGLCFALLMCAGCFVRNKIKKL